MQERPLKFREWFVLLGLTFGFGPALFAQQSDLDRAVAAYNSGDYATAIALFEPNAHQGNRDAQYAMGVAYYQGNGVSQDLDEALAWFRKAADSGHPTAMFNLGVAHWQGRGVPKSFAKAVDWWERAAELSDIASQYNLGLAYYQGKGAEKDLIKARNWLDKAAAQGHADAKRVLGIIGEQELVTQSTPTTTSSASSETRQTASASSGQTSNAAPSSTSNRTIVNVNFRAAQAEFDNLALRAAPSSESPPIGALDQGTPVKIIQTNGGWARIEVPRPIKFWVFGSYVDGAPQGRINANSVRLRTSPTTGGNSSIVAQLNRGDPVTVHTSSGDWKQVSVERVISIWTQLSGLAEQNPVTQSWVDNFNALSGATPRSTTTTESSAASTTVAYKAAWVNVDETPVLGRPEDGAALLNYVVKDTPVKALGSKGEWLMIQTPGGLDVWVYGKFVSESGSFAEINENRVRIRSLPSSAAESDILGLLDQGTRVEVISRKGDWIRARVYQSVAGWIKKDAATAPGDLSAGWQERWDAIRSKAIN